MIFSASLAEQVSQMAVSPANLPTILEETYGVMSLNKTGHNKNLPTRIFWVCFDNIGIASKPYNLSSKNATTMLLIVELPTPLAYMISVKMREDGKFRP
jgi:hypothetical protein